MFKVLVITLVIGLLVGGIAAAETGDTDFVEPAMESDAGCCTGRVGDVNMSGDDEPTLGDAVDLWMYLLDDTRELPCLAEADIDGSGGAAPTVEDITIYDVSMLIAYLYVDDWDSRSLSPCADGGSL